MLRCMWLICSSEKRSLLVIGHALLGVALLSVSLDIFHSILHLNQTLIFMWLSSFDKTWENCTAELRLTEYISKVWGERPLSILVRKDLTYFVLCIEMRDASRLLPSRNSKLHVSVWNNYKHTNAASRVGIPLWIRKVLYSLWNFLKKSQIFFTEFKIWKMIWRIDKYSWD